MRIPLPKQYYQIVDFKYKGYKIRTYRFGTGKKKIFSLPGFPHSGLIYLYFLLNYDLNKVTFITFDLPGWIGCSDNLFKDSRYDEEVIVDIAQHVIAKYNLVDFNVIGYSFGSSIAARIIGLKKYNIEKLVLVSPVLNGIKIKKSRWLLNFLRVLKLNSYFKVRMKTAFRWYKARLKAVGVDKNSLNEYYKLLDRADPRILLESINTLFTREYTEYLKDFPKGKIMIATSKDETPFIQDQAQFLMDTLEGEKVLYLRGDHTEFFIDPNKEKVRRVMEFLTE